MSRKRISVQGRSTGNRAVVIAVAAAVVTALMLRAWALALRGVLDYDETYYYILGANLFSGRGYTLNGLPHTAFAPLYPIFVGFTTLFTSNVRIATSAISAVAGALLPVPLYFIAKDVAGRRAGVLAAWLGAVWPAFFFVASRSVTYRERLYAGSEPLFLTLFTAGAAFLWLAARRDRLATAAWAGAFLGGAVLTRDEGLPLFAALLAWFAADRILFSKAARGRRVAQAALVAAAFMVVLSPHLIRIRSVTGRWSMGAKLENLARVRETFYPWVIEGLPGTYSPVHYALDESGTQFRDDYWGARKRSAPREGSLSTAVKLLRTPDMRWLPFFWKSLATDKRPLVPWYAWAFAIAGTAAGRWDGGRWRWLMLVAFAAAALAVQAVTIYSLARFALPLAALLVIPAALGIDAISRLAEGAAQALLGLKEAAHLAWAAAPLAVVISMAVSGTSANSHGSRPFRVPGAFSSNTRNLRIAEALRDELPAGASLMCNAPWIAAWAGMDWRVAPVAPPEALAKYALANGIDFAILGDWQLGPPEGRGALGPYYVKKLESGTARMHLYDFRKRASAAAAAGEPK